MILIGQYDSPFVRRVGIALTLYGMLFEHKPWSTFGEADKIRPYNPLTRVPTLVLDDGEVLIGSRYVAGGYRNVRRLGTYAQATPAVPKTPGLPGPLTSYVCRLTRRREAARSMSRSGRPRPLTSSM